MQSAPLPPDEAARQQALHDLDVLDSAPEAKFQALAEIASLVCGTPVSLLSLVDGSRQWFKANVGLDGVSETPRELAFCAHAILGDDLFEVPDATADPRFADNPLVTGAPDIRFYAGAPLTLSNGHTVGTLCVIDRQARQLTPSQRQTLRLLADVAVLALETRRIARQAVLSQAQFRSLSEAAPLGVFSTDAAGGCTYNNARWQTIFGLSLADSLGHGWTRTLHPEDKGAVFAAWQQATRDRSDFDMTFRVRRDDGTELNVRAVARPVVGEDGQIAGFVGSVEDITDRLRQDLALRRSERLLQRTGEMSLVGGWELDLAKGVPEWSDQTCRIHGVEPGYQARLDEAIDFYAPEARPVIQAAVQKAMATGEPWDLELPFIQAGGRRIWVRAIGEAEFEGGKPVSLTGAFQDISLRVQQRQALETAHRRMALATESGGIGVWDFDPQRGTLVWDAQMYQLYGLPVAADDADYDLWVRHLHPDDRAATEQAVQDALATTGGFDTEFRIVWADGSVHHLRAAARVTRDAGGQALNLVGVNWDVTHQRQLAADLAQQHELLRVTLESIGDAVITTDAEGRVRWLNPVAERMTGWLTAEALGRPLDQVFRIVHEETRKAADNPVAACLERGKISGLAQKTLLISRHGQEHGIEDSAAPIRGADGQVLGVVLVFHDVTEQRRLSGEMSYRASHDALTGLINRTEFENRLKRCLGAAAADDSHHALLYIDLDQFKLVNDACGHSAGDHLLQQVAKLMGEAVRSRDTLARLGGDEFGVILEHCTVEQSQRVAQQICEQLDDFRFVHDGQRFRIGASIGLVPVDARWPNVTAVLQAADTSCYAAKEAGRNRVHTWFDTDRAMQARQGEMRWAARLEQAIDENRFVLYAQKIEPLQAAAAGLHAEVLLRLRDEDGHLIPPGAFLPAAERFNLSSRIDRWVLQHAVARLSAWPAPQQLQMLSINLSGQSVGDRAFHRLAVDLLKAAGPQVCARVCLEITETAAITHMADAALFVEEVRALGVRTALDDFGAGASSFGYLKTLKVDLLKIDGQFVKDVIDDPLDDAAVRCFVDVARVVGLQTVAEFVDRPEVLARVREIGVDFAQGFLLHQPEPLDQVLAGWSLQSVG
jgi:diguanylate cyclase (GGDEF)-like protein/PAS domain S-box-containing protein